MSQEAFKQITGDFLTKLAVALPSAGFAPGEFVAHKRGFVAFAGTENTDGAASAIHWRMKGGDYALVAGTRGDERESQTAAVRRAYAKVFATCLLQTYRQYFGELVTFSKGRIIGDKKLFGDTHFRQVVGEMLTRADEAQTALEEIEPDLGLVFSHMGRISRLATRALGGRALLRGSIFELQILCQILGSTYVD